MAARHYFGNGIRTTHAARNRKGRVARTRPVTEELESRTLMSASLFGFRALSNTHTAHGVRATTNVIVETTRNASGTITPDATTAPTGYTPAQMRQAYNLANLTFGSIAATGAGQTIAIVDAYNDPNLATDLHTFDTQFGLADPTLSVLNESGGATLPGTDPAGRGDSWALETSLDVEWAHAMAPGAAIDLIEASSASSSDLFAAVNTARNATNVSAVSMSWGMAEYSGVTSLDSYFTTPTGHTGVTFVASSGDEGAYSNGSTVSVNYPAASPNVLAVGGTSLTLDSSGNYLSESAWGHGTLPRSSGGSGGGLSVYESQPSYQHGIVTQSSTQRGVPDIALDADPNTGVAIVDSCAIRRAHRGFRLAAPVSPPRWPPDWSRLRIRARHSMASPRSPARRPSPMCMPHRLPISTMSPAAAMVTPQAPVTIWSPAAARPSPASSSPRLSAQPP